MGQVFDVDQLDVTRLLEQWRWLCGQSVALVARNGFGDMFLRTNERKILWLNVGGGTLTEIAESELGFEHSLAESAKRELWFAEQQLAAFGECGLKPNDLQCIGFKTPVVFADAERLQPDMVGRTSGSCEFSCRQRLAGVYAGSAINPVNVNPFV